MTDRYAVIGNPVAHSKSPLIHAEFAHATGEDIAYTAIFAPLDGFRAAVLAFRDAGGRGMNVTLPFKHAAWALAAKRSARCEQAQAVNTLSFDADVIAGDNTDGVGLLRDIESNLGFDLAQKRVLLLGAGGAAWGVVPALLSRSIARLTIANRTVAKAVELRRRFSAAPNLDACGFDALAGERFDLVINATSAGLSDAAPPLPAGVFTAGALAYEMVYGRVTPFMAFARDRGARVADGLGMLVEQAAESFFIWRGVRPATAPVIALLRGEAGGDRREAGGGEDL